MSAARERPADVLLDLLRSVGSRGHSAAELVAAGTLFGFSDNQVRVTLSRLGARGLVESPRRGRYRLARRTDALNDFVERWRLGEQRVRAWIPGDWLLAHACDAGTGDDRSRWVLEATGFREARPGLWVRPDNLASPPDALRLRMDSLGLADDVLIVAARPTCEPVPEAWVELWRPREHVARTRALLAKLEASAARLRSLAPDAAKLESFRIGGEVIHALAKEPLLPAQLADPAPRAALTRAMLDYDVLGRRAWAPAGGEAPGALPVARLASA